MQRHARRMGYAGLPVLFVAISLMLLSLSSSGGVHAQMAAQSVARTDKVIVVSLSRQWLDASEGGSVVFSTPVMTGRPSLPTPTGTYHIFAKLSPATFTSPFPKGSANWYPPTRITYALEWKPGFFLHDSWWHTVYGPGTSDWHYDPQYGWQWGTHGCVAMPLDAAAWLYNWASIGTTVQIIA
jgi:lipoprotein-anchoring transpeptidase ErfK/SrfK